jgi:hypothetical protein
MAFNNVVLPDPLPPMIANISPAPHVPEAARTIVSGPSICFFLDRMKDGIGTLQRPKGMRLSRGGGMPMVKLEMVSEYGFGGGRDRISPGSASLGVGMADMGVQEQPFCADANM